MRVVDREGAAALSMRRVAEELGTGPASLYWHVANKDALINLIIDRVAGEIHLPEPDPGRWQEQLRDWLLEVRKAFDRHPGVAALTLGRVPVGPNLVRFTEWTLGLLRGAGIPDRIAAYSGDLLGLYLGATGYEATLSVSSPTGEPRSPAETVAMLRDY
jgi:AcrR family transcriptional regulator